MRLFSTSVPQTSVMDARAPLSVDRAAATEQNVVPEQNAVPEPMAAALAAFDRHLALERGLSSHTVRAYTRDIASLLRYAADDYCEELADLDIGVLRGWLGSLHKSGQARTSMARRAASARAFTAFGHQRGWLAADPGAQLRSPKVHRHLPEVLGQEQMSAVLTGTAAGQAQPPRAASAAVRPRVRVARPRPNHSPPRLNSETRPSWSCCTRRVSE